MDFYIYLQKTSKISSTEFSFVKILTSYSTIYYLTNIKKTIDFIGLKVSISGLITKPSWPIEYVSLHELCKEKGHMLICHTCVTKIDASLSLQNQLQSHKRH